MKNQRIGTIPNLLSAIRLCAIPLFVVWYVNDHRFAAAILLGVLGATDWIDGYVARRFHQVSDIGKILDPTADRLLLLTAIITLLTTHSMPMFIGVLVLAREVLILGAVGILAIAGAARIDVKWAGKAGTLALMVGLPAFAISHTVSSSTPWSVLAWVSSIGGLILSYWATLQYIPAARNALAEGRKAQGAET